MLGCFFGDAFWGVFCYVFCCLSSTRHLGSEKCFFRTRVWTYSFTPCNASITSSSTHLQQEKKD